MGAFADAALDYRKAGLAPVPCNGKRPLIKFRHFAEKLPPEAAVQRWASDNQDANLGIVTGPASKVTVVDIDRPQLLDGLLAELGDTPVAAATPSGGFHLYYRHGGEGCPTGWREGVDIRGRGGIIIAPPSRNPRTGKPYSFIRGGLGEFAFLPKATGLPKRQEPRQFAHRPGERILEGRRDDTLFRQLLREVRACDDFDTLLDVARTINMDCLPPLSDAQVAKAARSAWKYEQEDRNWVGREARGFLTLTELEGLSLRASFLLCLLRAYHACRIEPFAIAIAPYSAELGWSPNTLLAVIRELIAGGYLARMYQGGSGPGDPSLYRLTTHC